MTAVNETNIYEDLGLARRLEPVRKNDLGQEDFLELMVTQLRNQDPFKPMESGEFLGQLAQFGTVSGIESLESKFEELSTSLTSNQALQAATLVGRPVLVSSDSGALIAGTGLQGAVELPFAADQVRVGIFDSSGQLVKEIDLGRQEAGLARFNWDGITQDGSAAPGGLYELRAEATSGPVTQGVDTLASSKVESVTLGTASEPLSVRVEGLGLIDFNEIHQIG